jgi:hypothetical protein
MTRETWGGWGHRCDHGVWLTLATLISASALSIPGVGRLLFDNLEQSLMRWVRSAELTCDRAALLVAQVLPLPHPSTHSLPHPFPSQTPRDEAHRHIRCQEPMMCV